MSPPARPSIPLQMAGGRAQPGSLLRRPGTPTPFAAHSLAPAIGAATGFEFTFEAGVAAGTVAPPTSPAASDDSDQVAEGSARLPLAPAAPAQRPSVAARTTAATSAGRGLLVSPVRVAGGLYGQAYVVGSGHFGYETTTRMETWLSRLEALSLGQQDEKIGSLAVQTASSVGKGAASNENEHVRVGEKRSAPADSNDGQDPASDTPKPAAKRNRLGLGMGTTIRRTFSRMNQHRANSTTATNASRRRAVRSPSLAVATTPERESAIHILTAAATSTTPRPFSPFGSALSRVGSGASALDTGGNVGAPPSPLNVVQRTLKMCLVGDIGAGKTAFFNRLTDGSFVSTTPSLVPKSKSVGFRAEDDSVVNVELWDFPGIVAGERVGPLLSTFFHAAIICFNLEDRKNLAAVLFPQWKPKLDASLHDGDIFVLGMKHDLCPSFPTLNLSFLPAKEPVTTEMGRQVAETICARGYSECSARTNDNVWGAAEGIVSYIVRDLAEHERTVGKGRKRVRVRSTIAGLLSRCRLGRVGRGRE